MEDKIMAEEVINNTTPQSGGGENETPVTVLADNGYVFDGKYGPIPNADGTVDLSNYYKNYISNYSTITELPEENKKYLDEVFTTGNYKVTNTSYMFGYIDITGASNGDGCVKLTTLDVSKWDTSNVTNMSGMFAPCISLTSLDLSNWDTSKVTDMSYMFMGCMAIATLDVSKWDTSNVTNMSGMFAPCISLTSLDLSNWDTSKVTDMSYMFDSCWVLTSLDVSNWDTSKVTNMYDMFSGSENLKSVIGTIDLASCTNYSNIFSACNSLTSAKVKLPDTISQEDFLVQVTPESAKQAITFVKNLHNYLLDRNYIAYADAATFGYNFDGIYGPIPNENGEVDLSNYYKNYIANYDTITELPEENKAYLDEVFTTGKYKVTNMSHMFGYINEEGNTIEGCNKLTSIDVSNFDTSNVINMCGIFNYCEKLTSIDVSKWDTSNVTDMSGMFGRCSSLTSIEGISNFDTSNVTSMYGTFNYCESLTSLNTSNWDTSKVINMSNMFIYCRSLTSLDLSNWDTSKVTNMELMFGGCSSLTSLDLYNWDTSNVISMRGMFDGCKSLTSLDVSKWDTSNVTDMYDTFYSCNSLTSLDVSNWDTSKVTNMYSMFYSCSKLQTITGTIDLTNCSSWSDYLYMLYHTSALTSINIKLRSTITQSDFLGYSYVTNTSAVHFVS